MRRSRPSKSLNIQLGNRPFPKKSIHTIVCLRHSNRYVVKANLTTHYAFKRSMIHRLCGSHELSHFAAFFIDRGTEVSLAKSCLFTYLGWLLTRVTTMIKMVQAKGLPDFFNDENGFQGFFMQDLPLPDGFLYRTTPDGFFTRPRLEVLMNQSYLVVRTVIVVDDDNVRTVSLPRVGFEHQHPSFWGG